MDMQASGGKITLIKLESHQFELNISGYFGNKKNRAIRANENIDAYFNVDTMLQKDLRVRVIDLDKKLEEHQGERMLPIFFENSPYEIIIKSKNKEAYNIYHTSAGIRNSFSTYGNITVGTIKFKDEIGYSTFIISKNGEKTLKFTIEVFPSKMDYMNDYKMIMEEVNNHISSLAFEFMGSTFEKAGLKDVKKQCGVEFISILNRINDKFIKSIKRIEMHPKHNVLSRESIVRIEKARRVSRKTKDYIRKNASTLKKMDGGVINIKGCRYTPTKVVDTKKITTTDIFENRYVKFIIKKVLLRIKQVKKSFSIKVPQSNYYYSKLESIEKILNTHLRGFFKDVGDVKSGTSESIVFQMAPGYKEVYTCYSILKKGLDILNDIYEITPKRIWKLYEIWCYIKLNSMLIEMGYNMVENGIIMAKDNGLTLNLIQDKEAYCTYKNLKGKGIQLWYNKSYGGLPTANQRPDTVLCLKRNEDDDRVYIFDAKYRLCVDENGRVGPEESDINVMHRYRDAIVSEMGEQRQFKYNTFGAYVMFPYWNETEFQKNKFYRSIETVNIGAVPMLPGNTELMEKLLKEILGETQISAEEKIPSRGNEEFTNELKFRMKNVMVSNTLNKEHLEAYIKGKFYHIPQKTLLNIRPNIEYIAFYQTKKRFGEEAGVKFYGKIKNIKEYKRSECSELKCRREKENEIYYRFEIEEIKELPVRIQAVEYGTQIVSYTTLYLLLNAETIHELTIKSSKEMKIYRQALKLSRENGQVIKKIKGKYLVGNEEIDYF